jgi:hypothetical protein
VPVLRDMATLPFGTCTIKVPGRVKVKGKPPDGGGITR